MSSDFGETLKGELTEADFAEEMALSRKLYRQFNGSSKAGISMLDQAALIEELLLRCTQHSDGGHELVIATRLDAEWLAGLATTAMRLRKMARVEQDIRKLVEG